MSEIAVIQDVPAGWGRKLAWCLGAVVAGGFVPWVLVLLAIGAGMFVVATLGFGETWGVPTYLVLMALAALVYAGMIYGVIRVFGFRAKVPWLIWPALMVAPLVGLVLASPITDPRDVLANPTVAPAVIGIAIAFVTLGKHRWGRPA
ncbi:MAG: hypothetical protein JW733_01615 [Coriobacteriia bacterium]|nr:hypothetical protein [Coriobacteriia bacterium]MBN2847505.1 hypothetical protein [Coriobacteriia bacterium]